MAKMRFDLTRFAALPDTVAALVPADELFGFLVRSLNLPDDWAALVWREQGDQAVTPAGGRVGADEACEVLFVRTVPVEVIFEEGQLTSSDGYICSATLMARVSVVAERSELLSFRNAVMGSRRRVRIADLEQYLRWPVRQALVGFAEHLKAHELADGAAVGELRAALKEKLGPICFASGLVESEPARVTFSSAGLVHTRAEAERAVIARQALASKEGLQAAVRASREAHLSHLQTVLERLQELAERSPEVALSDLVRSFAEQERAQIYESLWKLLPPRERTRWLVGAAGQELLFYEPAPARRGDQPVRRVQLIGPAGALRSLALADDGPLGQVLLVGAARGVYVLLADAEAPMETHVFDETVGELRGGVNCAALTEDHVYATHSEVGLVRWCRHAPGQMRRLLEELTREAHVVRHVQVQGENLWLSTDDKVVCVPLDDPVAGRAVLRTVGRGYVASLQATPEGIYAGTDDGGVLFWPGDKVDEPETIVAGRDEPIESVHCRLLGGVDRLIFCDMSDAVKTRIVGDTFECRYAVTGTGVRRCVVAEDLLAGISANRDKVFLWQPDKPDAPAATLQISRLTDHTVQDICLVPVA